MAAARRRRRRRTSVQAGTQGRSDNGRRRPAPTTPPTGLTKTVGTTLTGLEDIGRELGTTALGAARASVSAAEVIGADLIIVARDAVRGALAAVERLAIVTDDAVRNVLNPDGSGRPAARQKQRSRRRTADSARRARAA